eukprot:2307637-Rhodomonas_salina.1
MLDDDVAPDPPAFNALLSLSLLSSSSSSSAATPGEEEEERGWEEEEESALILLGARARAEASPWRRALQ